MKVDFCVYCGREHSLTIDHIIPRIKGGSGELSNLTRACKWCNSYKSDLDMGRFLQKMIEKREHGLGKFCTYSHRLRRYYRKYNPRSADREWLIRKMGELRRNHAYYSVVIGSIVRGSYKIF